MSKVYSSPDWPKWFQWLKTNQLIEQVLGSPTQNSKTYYADYLIHTHVDNLGILDFENDDVKITRMKKISQKDSKTSMFSIAISFSAANNVEALRMAAINTDKSMLVFGDNCKLINYHAKLEVETWLGRKTLEDQFFLYKN